jgi:Leucine Rich repeat
LKSLNLTKNAGIPSDVLSSLEMIIKANNLGMRLARAEGRLDLKSKNIGDDEAKFIAKEMANNTSLEVLHLARNCIGADGVAAIAEVLKKNCFLRLLGLGRNRVGVHGAVAIANALIMNSSLSVLGLNSNAIDDVGTAALAQALKRNSSLTALYFGANKFGIAGLTSLADALKANTGLTEIHLDKNSIGDDGAAILATALTSNTSLATLDLSNNSIGNEGASALRSALLEANTTVKSLDLARNPVVSSAAVLSSIDEIVKVNEAGLRSLAVSKGASAGDTAVGVSSRSGTVSFTSPARAPFPAYTASCKESPVGVDYTYRGSTNFFFSAEGTRKLYGSVSGIDDRASGGITRSIVGSDAGDSGGVVVNAYLLNNSQVHWFLLEFSIQLKPHHFYWYDKWSGFFGKIGKKPFCVIDPGIPLLGDLHPLSSIGVGGPDSGVVLNGRSIDRHELEDFHEYDMTKFETGQRYRIDPAGWVRIESEPDRPEVAPVYNVRQKIKSIDSRPLEKQLSDLARLGRPLGNTLPPPPPYTEACNPPPPLYQKDSISSESQSVQPLASKVPSRRRCPPPSYPESLEVL